MVLDALGDQQQKKMDQRLEWMNEWCSENSNYPFQRINMARLLNEPHASGLLENSTITKQTWLQNCVEDFEISKYTFQHVVLLSAKAINGF